MYAAAVFPLQRYLSVIPQTAIHPIPAGLLTCTLRIGKAFSVAQWPGFPSPILRYCTVAVTVHDFHMVPYSPAHDRQALESEA